MTEEEDATPPGPEEDDRGTGMGAVGAFAGEKDRPVPVEGGAHRVGSEGWAPEAADEAAVQLLTDGRSRASGAEAARQP